MDDGAQMRVAPSPDVPTFAGFCVAEPFLPAPVFAFGGPKELNIAPFDGEGTTGVQGAAAKERPQQ